MGKGALTGRNGTLFQMPRCENGSRGPDYAFAKTGVTPIVRS